MNQPFKKFIKTVLFYTGLLALYRLAFCRKSAVILAYHSVRPHKFSAEDNFNVMPQTFEKQMRYLASHYQVLPLADVVAGKTLPLWNDGAVVRRLTSASPVAVGKTSDHKQLTQRLITALQTAESRERFKSLGFTWKATK